KFVLVSCLIPVGFGLYQFFAGTGIYERGFNRLYGTFAHSNVFAEYLFLVIFLLIFMMARPENRMVLKKVLLGSLLFLVGFCFYHTFTRTLWIAFAVSVVFYAFMKRN